MNLKDTYNRLAKDWSTAPWDEGWWDDAITHLTSLLPNNARVLDAGCGAGAVVRHLDDQGFRAEGFDFSEEMIKIARERAPKACFEVADVRDLHIFEDESYDAVIAQALLLHFPKADCPTVLKGLVSKLKPGGYFLLSVKEVKPDRAVELIEKDNYFGYDIERFFGYFTMPEVRQYLEDQNLQIVYENIEAMGPTYWLQVIGQKSR